MSRHELVLSILIVLVSIVLGFLVYNLFYHPLTGEIRSSFKDGGPRFRRWLKARRRRLLVIAAVLAAVLALATAGSRLRGLVSALRHPAPATSQTEAGQQPPVQAAPAVQEQGLSADHRVIDWVRLDRIPVSAIEAAKQKLHILYSSGTHGSQITYGLRELPGFKGPAYEGLDLREVSVQNDGAYPSFQTWAQSLRAFLNEPANSQTNVVMWSWTSELSTASTAQVEEYLNLMSRLEAEYPQVHFVYMTGHLDGTGAAGNLHQRNEQIRAFCLAGRKILFDFADIESYDPDGNGYLDKRATDGCWYDSNGDGQQDRNWAEDWSAANPGKWYQCYSAHTHPLNANMKAYAAWWLWARLAGWEGGS